MIWSICSLYVSLVGELSNLASTIVVYVGEVFPIRNSLIHSNVFCDFYRSRQTIH